MALVDFGALALEIGPEISSNVWSFIPIQSEPSQTFVDCRRGFFGITRTIGILDPQNECAAVISGNKPVEQRGAGSADAPITPGRRNTAGTKVDTQRGAEIISFETSESSEASSSLQICAARQMFLRTSRPNWFSISGRMR